MNLNDRSRAVILPYPCDPLLLNYWLKLAEKYWLNEVDKLYIYANSPMLNNQVVRQYIEERTKNPRIKLFLEAQQVEHGECINRMLDEVKEEYVMLIEDDGFIFKSGIVNRCFSILEQGIADIVASKRGSCGMEILLRAKSLWGLAYDGEGDQGCNFWPNFFFTKTDILRNTDRNFGAKLWKAGDTIPALGNYKCLIDQAGDTFVNTSLQLRAKGYKITYVPQYHGHPQDLEHYKQHKYLFDGNAFWTHAGSLSTGVNGLLKDNYNRPLSLSHEPKDGLQRGTVLSNEGIITEMQKEEMERRVQWFLTFYQERQIKHLYEFSKLYEQAIERMITQLRLNRKRIIKRQRIYKELGL